MIVPPYENDTKKSTTLSTPKTSLKTSSISTVSSLETSVTPRQRPKACQLNPVSSFTIGLPPSPSPRNIVSPNELHNFPKLTALVAKTPENFNAQFEVDFTIIEKFPVTISPTPATDKSHNKNENNKFNSLFKSGYNDPFGEHVRSIIIFLLLFIKRKFFSRTIVMKL